MVIKILLEQFNRLFENNSFEGSVYYPHFFNSKNKVSYHPNSNDWIEYDSDVFGDLNPNDGYEEVDINEPRKPKNSSEIVKSGDKYYTPYSKAVMADYEYVPSDNNINLDLSRVKGIKFHPNSSDWVEYNENVFGPLNKQANYETLDFNNPRKAKKNDDVVISGGKFYMPTRKSYGAGDNIKPIIKNVQIDEVNYITCFNFSDLGKYAKKASSHFFKGKTAELGEFSMNAVGNAKNMLTYVNDMVSAARNTKEFSERKVDFILYPQSSGKLNETLAKYLKKYLFPNALIINSVDDLAIMKKDSWGVNYGDMIKLVKGDQKLNKSLHKKYGDDFSKSKLVYYECYYRTITMIANVINGKLKEIVNNTLNNVNPKDNFTFNNIIYNEAFKLFVNEFEKANEEFKNQLGEEYVLNYVDLEKMFLEVAINTFGKEKNCGYLGGYKNKASKTYKRIDLYSSLSNFKKAFCGYVYNDGQNNTKEVPPVIYVKVDDILNTKKQEIKSLDRIDRYSLSSQFEMSDKTTSIVANNSDCTFLITDDNFSSGASIRNIAKLLIELGVECSNIIAMTPGDMGEAGFGNKKNGQIPMNNAEFKLATLGDTSKMSDSSIKAIQSFNNSDRSSLDNTYRRQVGLLNGFNATHSPKYFGLQ